MFSEYSHITVQKNLHNLFICLSNFRIGVIIGDIWDRNESILEILYVTSFGCLISVCMLKYLIGFNSTLIKI